MVVIIGARVGEEKKLDELVALSDITPLLAYE